MILSMWTMWKLHVGSSYVLCGMIPQIKNLYTVEYCSICKFITSLHFLCASQTLHCLDGYFFPWLYATLFSQFVQDYLQYTWRVLFGNQGCCFLHWMLSIVWTRFCFSFPNSSILTHNCAIICTIPLSFKTGTKISPLLWWNDCNSNMFSTSLSWPWGIPLSVFMAP